ncbi:MAG: metallophosphoesterase family protein, partial [Thermoleophilia bacterium]|nr:metallophosphoesterase family protein [Thermoleophilia bacterium]
MLRMLGPRLRKHVAGHVVCMIAVISDVHGNLAALDAVLEAIAAAGVTRIWCLGDTVGYGPQPAACLARVVGRCEIVLAGNHDLAVRGDVNPRTFTGVAGEGVRHSIKQLDAEARASLVGLKPFAFVDEAELYHASANDWVWEYVRSAEVASQHLVTQRLPVSFVGHSHLQLAYTQLNGTKAATGGTYGAGDVVAMVPDSKMVVNPGSVGQPRDRDPRAAWALYQPEVGVRFERTEYDIASTQLLIEQAGLPIQLAERLAL